MSTIAAVNSASNRSFTTEKCSFLRQSTTSVNKLVVALGEGFIRLQQEGNEVKPTLIQRIFRCFLPPELNLKIVEKIVETWNKCISALESQQGTTLLEGVEELREEKKKYPLEFRMIVPGISDRALSEAFYHISALGSLSNMFEAHRLQDVDTARKHLDTALNFFYKGGVSKNDPSLRHYREVFLDMFRTNRIR